jgi:hypothetical protein
MGQIQGLLVHKSFSVVVVAALLLTISGCNDGANDSPTPTPKPETFQAPIPISLPAAQTGPINFTNVVVKIEEIPETAWMNVQNTIASNQPVSIPTTFYIGPTTKLDVIGGQSRIEEIIDRQAQLWNGFSHTTFYAIYAYNAVDVTAAGEQFLSDYASKGYDDSNPEYSASAIRALAGNCQQTDSPGQFSGAVSDCRGANSGSYTSSSDSFLLLGQTGNNQDFYITGGGVIGHEFLHATQAAQWIGAPDCGEGCFRSGKANVEFSPCWLHEGGPNSVGPMVSSNTLEDYLTFRKNLPYGQGPTNVTDYTQTSLQNYLVNQLPSTCYQNGDLYVLGYTVGALATEALVAIAGPQAMMALFSLGAEGQDFPTAFMNVYGISWSDAALILSEVIAKEYEKFGPPPF